MDAQQRRVDGLTIWYTTQLSQQEKIVNESGMKEVHQRSIQQQVNQY